MLVLSRKKNESIVINDNITIQVLQIKGKQIRLGISAPGNMKILRGELPKTNQELNSTVVSQEDGDCEFNSLMQRLNLVAPTL